MGTATRPGAAPSGAGASASGVSSGSGAASSGRGAASSGSSGGRSGSTAGRSDAPANGGSVSPSGCGCRQRDRDGGDNSAAPRGLERSGLVRGPASPPASCPGSTAKAESRGSSPVAAANRPPSRWAGPPRATGAAAPAPPKARVHGRAISAPRPAAPGASRARGVHAAGSGVADAEVRGATGRSAYGHRRPGSPRAGKVGTPLRGSPAGQLPGEGRAGPPAARAKPAPTHEDGSRAASRSLTAAELAAASGLSESAVEELESYGILSGRIIGGVVHYDESEVRIARLAAEFAQFGIEPRHLRLYKHASEREAGFVEQLVLPLLKQRNPEARKRAAEMVADLTRLGQGLREALVRRNLKDLLGG